MDLRERPDTTSRHPWEVSRSRFFRRLIAAHASTQTRTVLDVGSGDNWFANELLHDLPTDSRIVCWDAHYTEADMAEAIDPRLHRTSVAPEGTYPLVLALDVLEHVEDDAGFLETEVMPRIQAQGLFIVSVPAFQWLFTSHDQALGHFRRHNRSTLRALLQPHLTIVQEGSLFTSLVPPRAVQRLVEHIRPPSGPTNEISSAWTHGRTLTSAITGVLDADARIGLAAARRRVPLPGLSLWAVCRLAHR